MTEPLPVTLLTGFLGSGKTTLLNRILRGDHGLRIGVLVNDFGDVNIDARLVASIEGDAISLQNGCVCCSMRGGLITSIRSLLARPNPPDSLLVEASGISDPHNIAATFRTSALRDITRLDGIIALVDAENARNPRLDAQLVHDQIAAADIVILNKADLVGAATLEDRRAWIRSIVPAARIVEAVQADVPLELVLGIARPQPPEEHVHDHNHGHEYATWTYRTDCTLAYRKLRAALESLPADVFRAKGIAHLADAPNVRFVVQVVGKRVSIDVDGPWEGEPPATELVFIGTAGAIDAAVLQELLDATHTSALSMLPPEGMAAFRDRIAMQPAPRTARLPELPPAGANAPGRGRAR